MRTERQPEAVSNPTIPEAVGSFPQKLQEKIPGREPKDLWAAFCPMASQPGDLTSYKNKPIPQNWQCPQEPSKNMASDSRQRADAWPSCLMLPAANCHLGPTTLTFLSFLWPQTRPGLADPSTQQFQVEVSILKKCSHVHAVRHPQGCLLQHTDVYIESKMETT